MNPTMMFVIFGPPLWLLFVTLPALALDRQRLSRRLRARARRRRVENARAAEVRGVPHPTTEELQP